jgi:hypothetical protein
MSMENPYAFKKIEEMPEKMQSKFQVVEGGGFVKKEAIEEEQIADLAAMLENQEKYEKQLQAGNREESEQLSGKDVLQAEANEINELRNNMLATFDRGEKKEFAGMVMKNLHLFRNDIGMIVKFVEASPFEYAELPDYLRNVDEVALKAIELNGRNILHAPDKFKKDKATVLMAAKGMHSGTEDLLKDKIISLEFDNDPEVIKALYRNSPSRSRNGSFNGSNIKEILENTDQVLRKRIDAMREKLKFGK